jgi:hypothetical protein
MQGYNPVSAFGRGPVGAIENRISSIMNRTAPNTDFARNQYLDLMMPEITCRRSRYYCCNKTRNICI